MSYQLHTQDAPPIVEDARTQAKRRIQHKRCLVCGARKLANQNISYFCVQHLVTHRWCAVCETLRTAEEHGGDSRCRQQSRADEIFDAVRRRIALAAFVAATPGWTWERRAWACGMDVKHIAAMYRKQCRGLSFDADRADWEKRRER